MSDKYSPDEERDSAQPQPEEEATVVESSTGCNAHYLKKRPQKHQLKGADNVLTLTRGSSVKDPIIQNLLALMPEGQELVVTEAALKTLGQFARRMIDGYQAAVPMICMGQKCPYYNLCPVVKAELSPPLLKPCPVETHLFDDWKRQKMIELEVDADDDMMAIDRNQINELAELEILQLRANWEMAMDPQTVREKCVGVDDNGEPIMTEIENPRINVISKLGKEKGRLLDDLVATRKARVKANMGNNKDASSIVSAFANAARKQLNQQNKESKETIVDVEIVDETKPEET